MANGHLQLHFERTDAGTILRVPLQTPPLRVVRGFTGADGMRLAHIHNLSGGVLGGDHLWVETVVGPGAAAQITSTGATRLYRRRANGGSAQQRTNIRVEMGGLLEYLPDVIIPYADACYQQTTCIELAADAGLFYWEVVAPGREASGELFQYHRLRLDLDIVAAGQLVALERVQLEPKLRPLTSPARLGPYRYFGTFYVCRVNTPPPVWLQLEARLTHLADQLNTPGEVIWGVSTLPAHGLAVRVASRSSRLIVGSLPQFWQLAKRDLYQVDAVLPRKVY
ncbi:MAG: urease accessory protein UreD [Chloroflexota bacterium]|nr:urease accessory protein UreD [Chloroflexota bacterium]